MGANTLSQLTISTAVVRWLDGGKSFTCDLKREDKEVPGAWVFK